MFEFLRKNEIIFERRVLKMKNNILRSVLLYVLGTTLTFVFYGLLGFIFNIVMGFLGAAKLDWLYRIFIFIFYIFVLDFTFYGSHKSKKDMSIPCRVINVYLTKKILFCL